MRLLSYMKTFHALSPWVMDSKWCMNCHYHRQEGEEGMHRCQLFGQVNVVTGRMIYEDCYEARGNDTKCSVEGLYYLRSIPFSRGGGVVEVEEDRS